MPEARDALDAIWRLESPRIVGAVLRRVRDLALAEELAQEAVVAALEHWPRSGVPDNPAAWLMTTALNRAHDRLRRQRMAADREAELAADLGALQADVEPDFVDAWADARDAVVGDDVLRLMFHACHPVLAPEARVALTLKVVAGLTTAEIARAFLVPEATLAQRLVRAKRTLSDRGASFGLPAGRDADAALAERLASVREVIYLVFNEGYAATSGDDWMRPALCDEALRLARALAARVPDDAETQALAALLELQASRRAARHDSDGRPVLLDRQDRARWDRLLVRRGLAALARADALAAPDAAGPLLWQARIAACHARAERAEDTDWPRIAALYAGLAAVAPSPVVTLNRAVAVARADGPAAGWALVEPLAAEPALAAYPWLWAVRGDLLAQLGRGDEARAAFERAAALAGNDADRALMRERAGAWPAAQPSS